MRKSTLLLNLVVLFLINFIFHLMLISKGPYHADCLLLALNAEQTFTDLRLHYLQGTGLPLTVILGAIFVGLGELYQMSDIVLAVNFMSVFLSALCVPVFYLLIKEMFDSHKVSFLGACVLTVNPLFLSLSVFGSSQIPSTLFFLFGLYFLFGHFRTDETVKYYVAALFFGLMGACRMQDSISVALPILLICLLRPGAEKKKLDILGLIYFFGIIAVTTLIFYIPYLFNLKQVVSAEPDIAALLKMVFNWEKINLKRFRIIFSWMLSTVSLIGSIGVGGGLLFLGLRQRKLFLSVFSLFFVPAFIYGCFWYVVPRYYLQSVIIMIIPLSYFFVTFLKDKKGLHYTVIILLIFSLSINLKIITKKVKFRHDYSLLSDFYLWMGQVTEPNAFIIERDHSRFIRYYSQREPMGPPVTLFSSDAGKRQEFRARIDHLIEKKVPVYVTYTALVGYPSKFKFKEFMLENFTLVHVGDRWIENWYSGVLRQSIMKNSLYRLHPKPQN